MTVSSRGKAAVQEQLARQANSATELAEIQTDLILKNYGKLAQNYCKLDPAFAVSRRSLRSACVSYGARPSPKQRSAVLASYLGWTLDAFDFFIFVFVMDDIAKEFGTDVTNVTLIFQVLNSAVIVQWNFRNNE